MPEEVLTDNGKQFTARFGLGGEVLFDRICRDNGIAHRLTRPASPTTTGKVERFHQSLRRELLDDAEAFTSLAAAQAAVDAWVAEYNTVRPHQALEMASPAGRFTPLPMAEREALPLRLPPTVVAAVPAGPARATTAAGAEDAVPWSGGPVEFDRIVPASGNLQVAGKQFWLGPARAGLTVTFWADTDVIHLLIAAARIKTVRSQLSVNDLAVLAARGGRQAGPPPRPPAEDGTAVEVDRLVNNAGLVSLAGHQLQAAESLRGRQVSIRIDGPTLYFFDPETRQLLRIRRNPLTGEQARRLRGARPADRRPGQRRNRSGCNAGPAPPERSRSAGRPSPSAAPTPGTP